MSDLKSPGMNRRQFLHTTGLGVAMFQIGSAILSRGAGRLSAYVDINPPYREGRSRERRQDLGRT